MSIDSTRKLLYSKVGALTKLLTPEQLKEFPIETSNCEYRVVKAYITQGGNILHSATNQHLQTDYTILEEKQTLFKVFSKVTRPCMCSKTIRDNLVEHAEVRVVNKLLQDDMTIKKGKHFILYVSHKPCHNCIEYIHYAAQVYECQIGVIVYDGKY